MTAEPPALDPAALLAAEPCPTSALIHSSQFHAAQQTRASLHLRPRFASSSPDVQALVAGLLHPYPESRPTATEALNSPVFRVAGHAAPLARLYAKATAKWRPRERIGAVTYVDRQQVEESLLPQPVQAAASASGSAMILPSILREMMQDTADPLRDPVSQGILLGTDTLLYADNSGVLDTLPSADTPFPRRASPAMATSVVQHPVLGFANGSTTLQAWYPGATSGGLDENGNAGLGVRMRDVEFHYGVDGTSDSRVLKKNMANMALNACGATH